MGRVRASTWAAVSVLPWLARLAGGLLDVARGVVLFYTHSLRCPKGFLIECTIMEATSRC